MRFEGKVVVVFGGAGGIGRTAAKGFATEGASVVVADVNRAGADDVARSITQTGAKAIGLVADISRYDEAPLLEHEPGEFERVVRVNLDGTFNGILA